MLEAVNLLFAHQLFVVVIAVDSRWLLESLKSEFSDIFSDEDAAAPTPINYLEKIIQVPFWLQPVRKAAFGRLVTNLVGDVDDTRTPTPRPIRVEEGHQPAPRRKRAAVSQQPRSVALSRTADRDTVGRGDNHDHTNC